MEEKIWNCIVKRLSGEETPASKATLDLWLTANELHQEKYEEAKQLWQFSTKLIPEEPAVPFSQFTAQLAHPVESKPKAITLFWKYGIAATITAVLCVGGLFYYKNGQPKNETAAWLVKKAAAGKMIKVTLPDSSLVWLNAASQISYAPNFTRQTIRLVKLSGEAYFEVKHDEQHPFVVESGELTTTVYGTSFSVRAYANEATTAVAVNSGKVGVLGANAAAKVPTMLLPNELLTYHIKNKKAVKSTILNNEVDAWTNGALVFEQTPIAEVIQTLARKYNVTIDATKLTATGCKLTARFNKQPITTVLKVLQLSLHIQSTQVEQTIYLKGGNCM